MARVKKQPVPDLNPFSEANAGGTIERLCERLSRARGSRRRAVAAARAERLRVQVLERYAETRLRWAKHKAECYRCNAYVRRCEEGDALYLAKLDARIAMRTLFPKLSALFTTKLGQPPAESEEAKTGETLPA